MIEETVDINTADGRMETFLCYPERGGPYPPVFIDGQENAPLAEERLLDAGTTTMRLTAPLLCVVYGVKTTNHWPDWAETLLTIF